MLLFLPIIGILLAIIIAGVLFVYFKILKPLSDLNKSFQELQKGNLNLKINNSSSYFKKVVETVNLLTSHLQTSLNNLEQSKNIVQAERHRIDLILSNIIDAVIAVDLNKNIVLFNKAAEILTGYNIDQVLGRNIETVIKLFDKQAEIPPEKYCPSDNNPQSLVFRAENLKLMSSNFANPNTAIIKPEMFVNVYVSQINEGDGKILGSIITLHDVSKELKLQQMQLDFVSMAAHELRTPLTSIKGYLSVFLDENKTKLNDDQKMLLQRVSNSAYQLNALVENLLNVSRIERGTFTINMESIDWTTFVKENVETLEERANEKGVHLEFMTPPQPIPKVKADKIRIIEVLNNLCSNAINYTPKGGDVKVWIETKDDQVITHIQDTGAGIPPEVLKHLFSKFYRVGGKLTQGIKGTGLGLYISKEIMNFHHGSIWVESQLGKGSTFSFSLPIYQSFENPFKDLKLTV
jgi:signal transduction histidine kinase